ncbi:FHA domain-containing protein [Microbacterium elymi]|uniref:FHA domain-containing protein n=1 Tax=Microbacterium elymi TaxID=2909587 RepID=A0ABY5NL41_9MICO|nr:FHA domain-containing protein [Microbacterium elymi]UUT35836.1 FHA domain-containing protein [Microbacterium elymi]
MRLKLTLRRQNGQTTDIAVTSDATATVQDVARKITETDPARLGAGPAEGILTLSVAPPTSGDHTVLDPDMPISDAPVGSGFVATVTTLGDRYASSRSADGPALATLHVVGGPFAGHEFALRKGSFTIGRAPENDIVVDDALVSKRHARIEVGTGVEVVDLNSANGIVVDGGLVQRLRVIPGSASCSATPSWSCGCSRTSRRSPRIRCSSAAGRCCSTAARGWSRGTPGRSCPSRACPRTRSPDSSRGRCWWPR